MPFSDFKQISVGLLPHCFWQVCKNFILCVRMENFEKKEKTFFEKKSFVIFFQYWAKSFRGFNKKSSAGLSKFLSLCPMEDVEKFSDEENIFSPFSDTERKVFFFWQNVFNGFWKLHSTGPEEAFVEKKDNSFRKKEKFVMLLGWWEITFRFLDKRISTGRTFSKVFRAAS